MGDSVIPQFLCDEDDSSFQDSGTEYNQHLLIGQAVEECGKVDVLQVRIQRPRQPDDLWKRVTTVTNAVSSTYLYSDKVGMHNFFSP